MPKSININGNFPVRKLLVITRPGIPWAEPSGKKIVQFLEHHPDSGFRRTFPSGDGRNQRKIIEHLP